MSQVKIFTAGMITESSDLTPVPTTQDDWIIETAGESETNPSLFRQMLILFRDMAFQREWKVAESICAYALPPGGRSVTKVYESLRDRILSDLQVAMPIDGVLLQLHGASLAFGYDDCEGDLLEKIRLVVGSDTPIGVELDPHCHLTEKMISNATILVCYKTFLHTDIKERAVELFEIFAETIEGKVRPVMASYDCRMVDFFDEAHEPMKSFLTTVIEAETMEGILSISPIHGFPLADVADMGAKMLVVADDNFKLATSTAQSLGRSFYTARGQMGQYGDVFASLQKAKKQRNSTDAPVLLVEFSDLAGCGFPTDGTELLHAMIDRGMTNLAAGIIWDPVAVSICLNAGVGANLLLRVGGKASHFSGQPLDLDVIVEKTYENMSIKTWLGEVCLGDVSVVSQGDMTLLLSSQRVLGYNIESLEQLGVNVVDKDYLIMKYIHDYDAAIFVYGSTFDYKKWHFKNADLTKWPWNTDTLTTG